MALGALGAPQLGGPPNTRIPPVPGDVTVGQAGDTCGSDLDLSCCDKVDQSGDAINTAEGLLAGLLEGGLEDATVGLFDGCSKLNVAAGKSIPSSEIYLSFITNIFYSSWS